MNSRVLTPACALALALSLPLVGCGSQQSSGASSVADSATSATSVSGSDSSSSSSSAVVPVTQETLVGDWTIVKMAGDGLTISGDFSTMGEQAHYASFAEDGTMSMTLSGTLIPGTWKLEGEEVKATLKLGKDKESDMVFAVNDDGTIMTHIDDGNGKSRLMVFSKSVEGAMDVPVDVTKAKAPTQASQVVGSWKTIGMLMGKVYAEGDLSQMNTPSRLLDLREDGTGTILQEGASSAVDITWEIASGACAFEDSGKKYSLLVAGDYLIGEIGETKYGMSYALMKKV